MRFATGPAVAAVLASILPSASGEYVRILGDERWSLSSKALNRSVPGRFPSHAHLDLLAAGVIGECCPNWSF